MLAAQARPPSTEMDINAPLVWVGGSYHGDTYDDVGWRPGFERVDLLQSGMLLVGTDALVARCSSPCESAVNICPFVQASGATGSRGGEFPFAA